MGYWKDKRAHGGDTVERSHDHNDNNFGLEEGVIKIGEVHVDVIDGNRQSQ